MNLGCASVVPFLCLPIQLFDRYHFFVRSTWTRVVLFLTSRMSARHCYTQCRCVFIFDGDTLLVCNGSEVQPKQEVVPRPAHNLGQCKLKCSKVDCFHYSASNFQNFRHPWSSRGCLHFKVRRPCLRPGCTCQMFGMF